MNDWRIDGVPDMARIVCLYMETKGFVTLGDKRGWISNVFENQHKKKPSRISNRYSGRLWEQLDISLL